MTKHQGTILVCDDEDGFRNTVIQFLEEEGHQVFGAATLAEGRKLLQELTPDVLLQDLRLPDGNGLEVVKDLQDVAPDCFCIILTAHASFESAVDALRFGAHDYLEKPIRMDDLVIKVGQRLEHKSVLRENVVLRRMVGAAGGATNFVAASPNMVALEEKALRIADRGGIVLLTGESGTGKEVLARFIHSRSGSRGAFVPVNLAAVSAELAEPQLFGHTKGAFTGATTASEGLARAAIGGTLFLDEITEAPLSLQAKLLRLVDRWEILPVGSTRPLIVNFRLIAATNRDIEAEVKAGRFREDLFHRLNVVRLTVPPLRERSQAVDPLTKELLAQLAVRFGTAPPAISERAMKALTSYTWPGNVRELKNALERAMILGAGDEISLYDLPEEVAAATPAPSSPISDLRGAVAEFERQRIAEAVRAADGNRREAARTLGISLASLYRKLGDVSE